MGSELRLVWNLLLRVGMACPALLNQYLLPPQGKDACAFALAVFLILVKACFLSSIVEVVNGCDLVTSHAVADEFLGSTICINMN